MPGCEVWCSQVRQGFSNKIHILISPRRQKSCLPTLKYGHLIKIKCWQRIKHCLCCPNSHHQQWQHSVQKYETTFPLDPYVVQSVSKKKYMNRIKVADYFWEPYTFVKWQSLRTLTSKCRKGCIWYTVLGDYQRKYWRTGWIKLIRYQSKVTSPHFILVLSIFFVIKL